MPMRYCVGIFIFVITMDISACYKIGLVLKPHGLKGEVTMSVDFDAPENLADLKTMFLDIDGRLVPHFIEYISARGSKAFIKFEDVDSPEAAHKISKRLIYIPKSERPKSVRGEFYDDEVVDFDVVDENGDVLGRITEVMNAGLNRLLVLNHHGREVLIPINSPFITSVNKSKKKISVNLPEGFLDI